jgi:DNA-binding Lrp family transcriptional regulator
LTEVFIARHLDGAVSLVVIMVTERISKDFKSLAKRTVEEQLNNELVQDYGFPKAICRSLVELFFSYFNLYLGADRADGQLIYRAIPEDVPPGVKTEEVKTHAVRLTLVSTEDVPVISRDTGELTRRRIVRLANEAFDQGGLLTQADLALLLGESPRTIGRRIKEIQDDGVIVPTRGTRMDIGPGISHKTKIVQMYAEGYDFMDIKRRTRHSSESIGRYLKDFARMMVLHDRGHSAKEIRIITGHSERLVREYLELLEQLDTEENQEVMDQLMAMYREKKKSREPARAGTDTGLEGG